MNRSTYGFEPTRRRFRRLVIFIDRTIRRRNRRRSEELPCLLPSPGIAKIRPFVSKRYRNGKIEYLSGIASPPGLKGQNRSPMRHGYLTSLGPRQFFGIAPHAKGKLSHHRKRRAADRKSEEATIRMVSESCFKRFFRPSSDI